MFIGKEGSIEKHGKLMFSYDIYNAIFDLELSSVFIHYEDVIFVFIISLPP